MNNCLIQNKYDFTKPEKVYYSLLVIAIYYYPFVFFKYPFELYPSYLVMFPLIPIFMIKYGFGRMAGVMLVYLLGTGAIGLFTDNNTKEQFLKIFLGLFFSFLFFDYYLKFLKRDIFKIFYVYLKVTYWICIIGIVQFVSYQIGFRLGYDYNLVLGFNKWGIIKHDVFGLRINSIFSEPAYFGAYVGPAVFVVLNNFINKSKIVYSHVQGAIILGTYIFTFSTTAYLGIGLSLFLVLSNRGFLKYLFFIIFGLGTLSYVAYNNVKDFRVRIDDTYNLFSGDLGKFNRFTFGKYHGSSLALYDNYNVAMLNLKNNNLLFGTGLGSHGEAFKKYSFTRGLDQVKGGALNAADANSLFLRILSELGLVGVGITVIFLFRFYIYKLKVGFENHFWVVSNACFVLMILNLLRLGHYFYCGFPLFVLMYYYVNKQLNTVIENSNGNSSINETAQVKSSDGLSTV